MLLPLPSKGSNRLASGLGFLFHLLATRRLVIREWRLSSLPPRAIAEAMQQATANSTLQTV